jgi:hypothetical protein
VRFIWLGGILIWSTRMNRMFGLFALLLILWDDDSKNKNSFPDCTAER